MRKLIIRFLLIVSIIFVGINTTTFNTDAAINNKGVSDDLLLESSSETFDVKTVIPEIVVIIIAGGVLLLCITKES